MKRRVVMWKKSSTTESQRAPRRYELYFSVLSVTLWCELLFDSFQFRLQFDPTFLDLRELLRDCGEFGVQP